MASISRGRLRAGYNGKGPEGLLKQNPQQRPSGCRRLPGAERRAFPQGRPPPPPRARTPPPPPARQAGKPPPPSAAKLLNSGLARDGRRLPRKGGPGQVFPDAARAAVPETLPRRRPRSRPWPRGCGGRSSGREPPALLRRGRPPPSEGGGAQGDRATGRGGAVGRRRAPPSTAGKPVQAGSSPARRSGPPAGGLQPRAARRAGDAGDPERLRIREIERSAGKGGLAEAPGVRGEGMRPASPAQVAGKREAEGGRPGGGAPTFHLHVLRLAQLLLARLRRRRRRLLLRGRRRVVVVVHGGRRGPLGRGRRGGGGRGGGFLAAFLGGQGRRRRQGDAHVFAGDAPNGGGRGRGRPRPTRRGLPAPAGERPCAPAWLGRGSSAAASSPPRALKMADAECHIRMGAPAGPGRAGPAPTPPQESGGPPALRPRASAAPRTRLPPACRPACLPLGRLGRWAAGAEKARREQQPGRSSSTAAAAPGTATDAAAAAAAAEEGEEPRGRAVRAPVRGGGGQAGSPRARPRLRPDFSPTRARLSPSVVCVCACGGGAEDLRPPGGPAAARRARGGREWGGGSRRRPWHLPRGKLGWGGG